MSHSLLYLLLCSYDEQDDYTALHHAVHRGHLAITVALLHRGAKINAAGKVLYNSMQSFIHRISSCVALD
jgi:ankyrin repeat protein